MKYALALRLEGPLQAWATTRAGDTVPTELVPTLSGITGLLGAAVGVPCDELSALRALQDRFALAVRIDRPGRTFFDFQTVRGMPPRAGARPKDTVVSWREYLADASFLALCVSDEAAPLAPLLDALTQPRWTLALGRFACAPSRPILAARELLVAPTLHDLVGWVPRADRATASELVLDAALSFDPARFRAVRTRTVVDRLGPSGFVARRVLHVVDLHAKAARAQGDGDWFAVDDDVPATPDTVDDWFAAVDDLQEVPR